MSNFLRPTLILINLFAGFCLAETRPDPHIAEWQSSLMNNELQWKNDFGISIESENKKCGPITYDPVIWTIAAQANSVSYKNKSQYVEVNLKKTEHQLDFYKGDVVAHYRPGSPDNKRLFIIFSSTYSTWANGSWIHQMAKMLDWKFSQPHLLVFEGHMVPSVIQARKPRFPDIYGSVIAKDLYPRIKAWTKATFKETLQLQTGLIGFSGGANIVINLLKEDSAISPNSKQFTGGLALSPVLDAKAAFTNIDNSVDDIIENGHSPNDSLMHGPGLAWNIFTLIKQNPLNLTRECKKESMELIRKRFINEFVRVDLHDMCGTAVAPDFIFKLDAQKFTEYDYSYEGNRYLHFLQYSKAKYLSWAISNAIKNHPGDFKMQKQKLDELTQEYEDLSWTLKRVDSPLYIVFPIDDPVLSRFYFDKDHPITFDELHKDLKTVIALIRSMKHSHFIRVFTPDTGAHMAYFLDKKWLSDLLYLFFKTQAQGQ